MNRLDIANHSLSDRLLSILKVGIDIDDIIDETCSKYPDADIKTVSKNIFDARGIIVYVLESLLHKDHVEHTYESNEIYQFVFPEKVFTDGKIREDKTVKCFGIETWKNNEKFTEVTVIGDMEDIILSWDRTKIHYNQHVPMPESKISMTTVKGTTTPVERLLKVYILGSPSKAT